MTIANPFAFFLLSTSLACAAQLEVRLDAPARAYLTDAQGRSYFPPNTIVYDKARPDGISERHFLPPHGSFSIDLPAGQYHLTIERGKEFVPFSTTLALPAEGTVHRAIALHRWVDMSARGWYSADMHVHRPLRDLASILAAEDLNVAVPITRWKTNQKEDTDPDLAKLLGAAPDGIEYVSAERFFPILNEELEPRASALLASWLGKTAVPLEYPLARFAASVKKAGGLVDSEKPTSLELPALAALHAFQTVGLVNNHIWRRASYSAPWGAWPDRMIRRYPPTCAGFVQSGFDMYSALLNAGEHIVLSAGSASGVHPVPAGWSRVYVQVDGALTPAKFVGSLRAGRSFVTTGPMLLLTVNGKTPGEQLDFAARSGKVKIGVEMLSLQPVEQAEIVINGRVHQTPLTAAAPHRYLGHLSIALNESSWITARWLAPRGKTCDAAHTSPVYATMESRPVPIQRTAVELLRDRVNSLINDVNSDHADAGIVLDSRSLRAATLNSFERARAALTALDSSAH